MNRCIKDVGLYDLMIREAVVGGISKVKKGEVPMLN
jgi:hypothetical protein